MRSINPKRTVVACSSTHATYLTAKTPPPPPGESSSTTTNASLVMVQEDGQCELSLDCSLRTAEELVLDFQGTPVMGGTAPSGQQIPRYVAGEAFFNYQLFGSLRKGGTVSLLAPMYRGYALAAVLSGYVYVAVMHLLLRLPDDVLFLDSSSTRIKNVLSLQWTVVLLVGVMSDAFAVCGFKRKSFIVAGWTLSSAFWLVLFVLFQSSSHPAPAVTLTFIILAFLGLVIATNALDIRVIELSQQEEVHHRGRLLGAYQVVRISGQVVMHALIAIVARPDTKTVDFRLPFDVGFVFLHLCVVCAVPLYWLVHNAHEDRVPHLQCQQVPFPPQAPEHRSPSSSLVKKVWLCMQQRVVWQLMLFNSALFFFGLFEFTDVKRALQFWSQDSSITRLVRNSVGDVSFVVCLLVWRMYGINTNWRRLTAGVLVFFVIVLFSTSTLIILDGVRASWVCTLGWVLRAPFRVLILLAPFVPTVEIAPAGTEGTTYALLSVMQNVAKLLAAELARTIARSWPSLQFQYERMAESSSETEHTQFYGLLVMTLVVLCALLGLKCLPQQKLDAQQLRVYGGYSRVPVLILGLGFLVAFPYVSYMQISRL